MEINTIHIPYEPGQVFSFSMLETHFGAQLCDIEEYHRVMGLRSKDPNHYSLFVGDTCDLIMPRDEKRYQPSATVPSIMTRDDCLNAAEQYALEHLKPYAKNILLIAKGNHEMAIEKRSGYDITSGVVGALRDGGSPVMFGGICGFLKLAFIPKGRKAGGRTDHRVTYTIFYHHGVWCGKSIPKIQVEAFAYPWQSWDCFAFGHNHQLGAWAGVRLYPSPKGDKLMTSKVLFANVGAFLRSYGSKGTMPDYAEQKALPPKFLGCPMLKVAPGSTTCKAQVITGEEI